jgi:hypothetical protein
MSDVLHSLHEAISLPLWAQLVAIVIVACSPLVLLKWRRKSTWHNSHK